MTQNIRSFEILCWLSLVIWFDRMYEKMHNLNTQYTAINPNDKLLKWAPANFFIFKSKKRRKWDRNRWITQKLIFSFFVMRFWFQSLQNGWGKYDNVTKLIWVSHAWIAYADLKLIKSDVYIYDVKHGLPKTRLQGCRPVQKLESHQQPLSLSLCFYAN